MEHFRCIIECKRMPETMSTSSQTNGKKSSNSSIVNTPASTPLTNTAQLNNLQNSPPPNNNAPKYGKIILYPMTILNQL